MVPDKLERVTSAIDDSKSEYERLLKLKPIYTIVSVYKCFTYLLSCIVSCLTLLSFDCFAMFT